MSTIRAYLVVAALAFVLPIFCNAQSLHLSDWQFYTSQTGDGYNPWPGAVFIFRDQDKSGQWSFEWSKQYHDNVWWYDVMHYCFTPYSGLAPTSISMTFRCDSSLGVVYRQLCHPSPCWDTPAQVRLFFALEPAEDDNDPIEDGIPWEFHRWWSNPVSYTLGSQDGQNITLSVTMLPTQWSSVYGKFGNDPTAPDWGTITSHIRRVGFTFGGTYFGHGVWIPSGSAKFTLIDYKAFWK